MLTDAVCALRLLPLQSIVSPWMFVAMLLLMVFVTMTMMIMVMRMMMIGISNSFSCFSPSTWKNRMHVTTVVLHFQIQ